jgi:hypothetical protein
MTKPTKKYMLLTKELQETKITIDESAKEDIMKLMGWDEYDWKYRTRQFQLPTSSKPTGFREKKE